MPSPQEIFIESAYADEYDTVYGEWPEAPPIPGETKSSSSSMTDASSPAPYIRLDSHLRNVTRVTGRKTTLKCHAVGSPLPITFTWYKNGAPLERDARYKIKSREHSSWLRITKLRVLDTAYYKCVASNVAGEVETTAVLTVKPGVLNRGSRPHERESSPSGRSRARVDDHRAVPHPDVRVDWMVDHRRGRVVEGECQVYRGEACRGVLTDRRVMIEHASAETIRDIDRDILAAQMTIAALPAVSSECAMHARVVACFHRYHICSDDSDHPERPSEALKICADDCATIVNEKCPNEFALAAAANLVGDPADNPKVIFPECSALPSADVEACVPVLNFETVLKPSLVSKNDIASSSNAMHTCYVGGGCAYRGETHVAENGVDCQPWTRHASQSCVATCSISNHALCSLLADAPYLRGSHAYCRNPDGRPRPWCYTLGRDGRARETPCHVPKCPEGMYGTQRREEAQCSPSLSPTTPTTRGGRPSSSITSLWTDMDKASQYAVLGGAAGAAFMLILLLVCCVCCCRKRSKSSSRQSRRDKQTLFAQGNGVVQYHDAHSGYGGLETPQPHTKLLSQMENHNPHQLHQSARLTPSIAAYSTGSTSAHTQQQQLEMQAMLLAQQQQLHPAFLMPQQMPITPHTTSIQVPEIGLDSLKFVESLGAGAYGVVWKGEMSVLSTSPNASQQSTTVVQVAIKTLKDGSDPRARIDFEEEISLCAQLHHANIVQLIGMGNADGKPYAVFEYMIHGNLNEFLLLRSPYTVGGNRSDHSSGNHSHSTVTRERLALDHNDFAQIATQIAAGMEYLAAFRYVHRDLATRNTLVTDRLTIKIADFGLCRDTYASDYYTMQTQMKLPVRWMPQEAIVYGKFSEASDVWSYGVTLWEIYSYGRQPYLGYTNEQVIEMIRRRILLEAPPNCPGTMYSMMMECWNEQADRRPRFAELSTRLQSWVNEGHVPHCRSPSRGSGHRSTAQLSNRSMSRQSSQSSGNNNQHGKAHAHHPPTKSPYHVYASHNGHQAALREEERYADEDTDSSA